MKTTILLAALLAFASPSAMADTTPPWMDRTKSADARTAALVAAMTEDEKLTVVLGYTDPQELAKLRSGIVDPAVVRDVVAHQVPGSAGYVPGVPRLGIPAQSQTDASIGVRVEGLPRTALPSSLATAASFDPRVTEMGGVMIAGEARRSGFNVFLAGGANLAREPRNGRNFEYAGEDPLLAGVMVGGLINGIQSTHMVSTTKHFAVNDQETLRTSINAVISHQAARQSDLLAFEMVMDRASPGSVMCAYNLVNGRWACENDWLLNTVLKHDWGFRGYVMSDWGAVHSTVDAANNGLDQMTGFPCCGDGAPYFGQPLKDAIAAGKVPPARLDDMARRILWPLFAKGVIDDPQAVGPIDFAASAEVSHRAAVQSLVLLKNRGGLLPLKDVRSIAVIGGHADRGVMAGGGSSNVTPVGGNALEHPPQWVTFVPSSPYRALKAAVPGAQVAYDDGKDTAAAARLAAGSDVAVVFVTQWNGEGGDGRLELADGQDALVATVAKANPKTIVVVESGGAVLMPWLDQVPAVLEAFYPGARGGEAIADILTGKVNPSGHLPITFPASTAQLAHPVIPGLGKPDGTREQISYDEGAAIGYKWYDLKGFKPLFAFGHGLSYTDFALSGLEARSKDGTIEIRVTVKNTGKVPGAAVPQIYVAADPAAGWEAPKRLGGFEKVMLQPGESRTVHATIDPRLLATWREADDRWVIAPGVYRVLAGQASDDLPLSAQVALKGRDFSAIHSPAAP
jgi:beta-glucosidase